MQYRHTSEKQRFFAAGARECTLRIRAAKRASLRAGGVGKDSVLTQKILLHTMSIRTAQLSVSYSGETRSSPNTGNANPVGIN